MKPTPPKSKPAKAVKARKLDPMTEVILAVVGEATAPLRLRIAELEDQIRQCDLVLTMVPHRGRDDNYMRIFGEEFVTPIIRRIRGQSSLVAPRDGKKKQ